ncbi:DUF7738 domain-containing protein [Tenacibaculum jejuense]|uniref:DUF7738 domain-containing protein n=1 Tax=Tenacibaculum jejuense TaxID=584609 RepID=A0A238U7M3_9FLAO|nr:hypothetical protein [Tenacibaculum jejuense]SNR15189.1 protein of unknown function [Tenacibaculum jejuense]
MFTIFKKKKQKYFIINCNTDSILVNGTPLTFPTDFENLVEIFGKPSRTINSSSEYVIWDDYGVSSSLKDDNKIVSINVYQNINASEYVPKKPYTGTLFFEEEDITFNEFSKIGLGKIAIHRLGSENETRFGFSLGINNDYKA